MNMKLAFPLINFIVILIGAPVATRLRATSAALGFGLSVTISFAGTATGIAGGTTPNQAFSGFEALTGSDSGATKATTLIGLNGMTGGSSVGASIGGSGSQIAFFTSPGSISSGDPATDWWVITAGISISDSTPPSDSARVKRRVDSQIAVARSTADRSPRAAGANDTIPPPARIWRAASAMI